MLLEIQHTTSAALQEYVAEQVDIIRAIPEGLRLAEYPTHDDTSSCWCHPRLVWSASGFALAHKDLDHGEFES